jgi:hypothetical protein
MKKQNRDGGVPALLALTEVKLSKWRSMYISVSSEVGESYGLASLAHTYT